MKTIKDKLSSKNITFANACRENTGAALGDSGDAYGRHWEDPNVPNEDVGILSWDEGCSATINTAAYLNDRFEIDRAIQKKWETYNGKHPDYDWFESGKHFMESIGYTSSACDNVYNQENTLSQVFIYEVWLDKDGDPDDYWNATDNAVVVIHIHTGCDVRGGYGRPIFCKAKGDYCIPMDLSAEYVAEKLPGPPVDPRQLMLPMELPTEEWMDLQEIDEHWQCGYSNYPYGQLENDVEEWHEDTRTRDSVEVTLKTGKRILVRARVAYV
jgi:hypothetical protein